jgi:thioredoxin
MSKNVLHFSPNNSFDKEVIEASKKNPVVVDFFATWCGPCKKLSPLLEEASSKHGFKLVVVDVEKNNDLAREYNVSSIPHVFLFHKGNQVTDFRGFDVDSLNKMIDYIKKNTNKFSGKGVSVGGDQVKAAKSYNYSGGDIPEEPPESDDTYEINFRYNNETFGRRFLCVNTVGQMKAYVRSKIGVSNISLFTPFPRKVYDDDNAILLDVGLSKREMLNVGLV